MTKASKKTPEAKKTKETQATKTVAVPSINAEGCRQLIANLAYLKAEKRGFTGGNPEQDWLEAEKEISAQLTAAPQKTVKKVSSADASIAL